jgi:hypothetical protein
MNQAARASQIAWLLFLLCVGLLVTGCSTVLRWGGPGRQDPSVGKSGDQPAWIYGPRIPYQGALPHGD